MFNFLKKYRYLSFLIIIFCFIIFSSPIKAEVPLADKLSGKILLQVEDSGEAWYVSPVNKERYFLGRPDDAFSVMRSQGVGITNNSLSKIPIALDDLSGTDSDSDNLPDILENSLGTDVHNADSDSDGYNDYEELSQGYNPLGSGKLSYDFNFTKMQAGKIFLQVERNGEAWYVNPEDNKRYFLGKPADAFAVMRNLGLGISNSDLDKIVKSKEVENPELITKVIKNLNPDTGEEMPPIKMTITKEASELIKEMDFGIISMPSVKDFLRGNGTPESDPKMRVIGPFYQMSPQGEEFGSTIDFSFCYFDEHIEDYDESLFYIGKETSGVWENIGGTVKPDENCVEISLDQAPDYTFAVYAGIEE